MRRIGSPIKGVSFGRGRSTARGAAVAVIVLMTAVAAFSVSFVAAQESQEGGFFLPWHNQGGGGASMSGRGFILRGLTGQSAVGTTELTKDENTRNNNEWQVILGFHTGALADTSAFQPAIPTATNTPLVTSTPIETASAIPTDTETPGPDIETPTDTPVPSETALPEETPTPLEPTPEPTDTPTATPTQVPATAAPTNTPVPPTSTATVVPDTATPYPTQEPLIVVVTSEPEEPTPTATPEPGGGPCSAPAGNGPRPADMGLLMILGVPLVWRFGLRR